jgi:hypothetical protein
MSTNLLGPNGPYTEPTLPALLAQISQNIFASLNCHQVGSIVSFNPDKQTAEVQLTINRVVYNQVQVGAKLQMQPTILAYPLLVDCPVFVLSGGNGLVTMPVKAGDPCLVLFGDRDIDNWFSSGLTAPPNSPRMHSLSDGFALVGFRPQSASIANYATDAVEVRNGASKAAVKDDGTIALVSASAKMTFSNDAANMRAAVDYLCEALLTWVNTGGSTPNPATVIKINLFKTEIQNLFKT